MAEQDVAIVVGIARYRDPSTYPNLGGPLNDVDRVTAWLGDPTGGAIPSTNIFALTTPAALLSLAPGTDPDSVDWQPSREAFSKKFNRIAIGADGEFVRRAGRLYLYFSGHGFSQQADQTPAAALYAADTFGKQISNLAGTLYAQAAKRARLFTEVVLLMDCCRDVESNVEYSNPDLNKVENDGSETVRVFAVYAAPKRGKAQERELPEPGGNKVVGLMTTAWLRALREAPCDVLGRVPSKVLMQYITFNWSAWYPPPTPPVPRVLPPETGELYFSSGKQLFEQRFTVGPEVPDQSRFRLTSDTLNANALLNGQSIVWQDASGGWDATLALMDAGQGQRTFSLRLPVTAHTLSGGSRLPSAPLIFQPGDAHVELGL